MLEVGLPLHLRRCPARARLTPGSVLGTVSIVGLLGIPLGTMLIYGLLVGPLTAVLTVFVFGLLLKRGFWNPDEDEAEPGHDGEAIHHKAPSLGVSMLPVLVPLVLIAFGANAERAGFSNGVIAFLGNPVFALFLGMLGTYLLARSTVGREHTDEALEKGFDTTGQIMLITGVGGSLGAVIGETRLDTVLGSLFTAEAGMSVFVGHPRARRAVSTCSRSSSGSRSAPARCSPCR